MIGRNVPDGAERVLPEGRTAYEAWARSLPQCVGYEGACDGNLVGLDHEPNCPMFGKEKPTFWDAWQAASRPVQQPATEPELRTRLLKIAAKVAHRQYLPSLEGCRTINDARIEVSRYDEFHAMLAQDLKSVLDEFAKARHVPVGTGWISVEENFPKLGRRVFVSVDGKGYKTRTIGVWTGTSWSTASLEKPRGADTWPIEGTVTHWMEMPEPPLAHSPEAKEPK